jgi:hypothetical protein
MPRGVEHEIVYITRGIVQDATIPLMLQGVEQVPTDVGVNRVPISFDAAS